ncbi:MAG TPA: hypothetical protein VG755_35955 [Nannocystaceae bacterium]|nr:hypothetical protein [Nannocystaceae bacterium]
MSVAAAKGIAIVSALIAAACVAVRYPPIAAMLPAIVSLAAFGAAGLAIGATAAAEARLPRGSVGPLWMRVAAPARLALAMGLSFCTTAIAQVLEISLGPVDPTFPASAPAGTNALWFFVFTIGFAGIGMMSAPGVFLPVLHPIARALKKAPLVVAVLVMGGVLAAIGLAFAIALGQPALAELVGKGKAWVDANTTIVTVVMLALTVGPALLPSRGDD